MDLNVPRIFNVVVLILLLVGAFAPGWRLYTIADKTFHVGLFYSVGLGKASTPGLDDMLEVQIEIVSSVILCFLATIFTYIYKTGQSGHSFLLSPIFFNLLSGIAASIAVGRFSRKSDIDSVDDLKRSYSVMLSSLGGTLCFIVVIILCVKKREDSYLEAPASSSRAVFTNVAQPQLNLGYGMQTQPQNIRY